MNNVALIWSKSIDKVELQQLKVKKGEDFELHDGYVSYKTDQRTMIVIPMARIDRIEIYS